MQAASFASVFPAQLVPLIGPRASCSPSVKRLTMPAFNSSMLGAAYHAIVRWEEELLEARLGEAYRAYAAQVPRWIPSGFPGSPGGARRAERYGRTSS